MTKTNQKIPEGWSVTFLENLTKHVKYGVVDGPFGSNLKSEHYRLMGIPVIQSGFVTSQKFMANNYLYVDEALFEREKRSATHAEDIIMAKIGAQAGTCALLPKGHPEAILAGNCLKITINPILAKNTYILEILHRKYEKDGFIDIKSVTAQPAISLTHLKKLKLLLPPLAEQEKIAEILSCWDEGIEKLSALIEKKKIQKKALMQQLLTGKHRLKGFATPWHEVKLGDIAEKITRKNLNQYTNVVTISAQNGFILQQQFFSKSVAGEDLSSYNLLKCGEFGYNRSYSKGFPMGAIKRLDLFDVAPVSSLYICFSVNEYIDSNFMVNYFDAGLQNYELYKVAQEGARNHGLLNISLHDFFNIKLYIPSSLAEQKAIADILSKADKEIELLNKKLAAFKLEKKGLMQKLLTGQIRVKVN